MKRSVFKVIISVVVCMIMIFQSAASASVYFTSFIKAYAASSDNIYVSPDGSDSWSGSLPEPNQARTDGPLKTAEAAKNKIRSDGQDGRTVYFREGTYHIGNALTFTSADPANTSYCAYNGEKVVFSGAYTINNWKAEYLNGIPVWTAEIDASKISGEFNTLYSSEGPLVNARLPESGYFYAAGADPNDADDPQNATFQRNHSFYSKENDIYDFYNINDVYVKIYHYWTDDVSKITSFDSQNNKVYLSKQTNCTVSEGNAYYVENVREALDKPGEWYIDKPAEKLYYIPFENETIDSAEAFAGSTETLITANNMNGLSFSGISFADTNWNYTKNTSSQAAYGENKCISVQNSVNVNFENCEFRNIGAVCIWYGTNVKNCTVSGCSFNHLGSQAVAINGANDAANLTQNITVTDNHIQNYGEKREQAAAVFQTYASDCTISHNEIHSGPYTAVSVGWTWGYADNVTCRNTISDNLIYDIGHTALSDMGGIYTLGIQNGTVISGNVIHDVAAGADASTYGGWGIYLDEGSSNIHVRNNLVYNCDSQGFHQHYGQSNQIYNNIFAFNVDGQVRCSKTENDKSDYQIYLHNNILVGDNNVMYQQVTKDRFSDNNNLYYDTSATKGLVFSGNNRAANSSGNYNPDVMKNTYGYYVNGVFENPDFTDSDNFNFNIRSAKAMQLTGFNAVSFENVGSSTFGSKYLVNTLAHERSYYPAQMWNEYTEASGAAKSSRSQENIERLKASYNALDGYSGYQAGKTVYNNAFWKYTDAEIYADTSLSVSGVSSGNNLIKTDENYVQDYTNTYDNTSVKAFARSKNSSASAVLFADVSLYDDLSQTPLRVSGSINSALGRSMRYYCVLQSVSNYDPSFGTPDNYTVGGKTYYLSKGGWKYPFVGKDGGYDSDVSNDNFGGMTALINGPVPAKNESVSMRISGEVLVYSTAKSYYYCADNYIDLTVTGVDKGELRRMYNYCVENGRTGTSVTLAKSVLDSYSTSQSEIDSAVYALKNAYGRPADVSALQALLNQAPACSSVEYTAQTWKAYQSAKQNAEALCENPFVNQSEVNAAYSALDSALDSLVECRSIVYAMTQSTPLNKSDYSQYAWYEFNQAESEAAQCLISASADNIEEQAEKLTEVKASLENHRADNITVFNKQTLHKPMNAMTTTYFYTTGVSSGNSLTLPQINFDDESSYDNFSFLEQFNLYVVSKSQSATANIYIDRSIISDVSETGLRVGADFTYITAYSMRLYLMFVNDYTPTIANRDTITVNGKTYRIEVGTYLNPVLGGANGADTVISPPLENVKGKSGRIFGPVPEAGEKVTLKLAACTFNRNFNADTYYCADNYIDFNIYGVDKAEIRRFAFEDYAKPEFDSSAYSQSSLSEYQSALDAAKTVIYGDTYSQQEINAAAQRLKTAFENLKITAQSRVKINLNGGASQTNLAVWRTVNYDSSLCGYPSHRGSKSSYMINDFNLSFKLDSTSHGYAFMPVYMYVTPGNSYTLTLRTSSRASAFLAYNSSYSHGWNSFPQFYQFSDISYTLQPDGTYIYKALLSISEEETVDGAYLRIEASGTLDTITVSDIMLTPNDDTDSPFDEICYFGDVLFLPEPNRNGYHFGGWKLGDSTVLSGSRYTAGQHDETLTAVWKDKVLCSDVFEVDYQSGIIYGIEQGDEITLDSFYLSDNSCTLSISKEGRACTGITVNVLLDGKVYESYKTAVWGDLDGDGECDARDAVIADSYVNGMLSDDYLGSAKLKAADFSRDGKVDQNDVSMLVQSGLLI